MSTVKLNVTCRATALDRAALTAVANAFAARAEQLARRRGVDVCETVEINICGDRTSRAAHAAVMDIDTATDVITIPYAATPLEPARGELIVNLQEAVRAASARDPETLLPEERDLPWSAAHELALYIAHGFDHLAGSDDNTPARYRAMRERELTWLAAIPAPTLAALVKRAESGERRAEG